MGSNGLDNSVDNNGVDDYADVNGKFDNTQQDNFTDSDRDVNSGGNVDYRDDSFDLDTDGDMITDDIDIDDDNDGILDTDEGCDRQQLNVPGAEQIFLISGDPTIVYNYDVPTSTRTQIATLNSRHNALAYNTADRFMWANDRSTNVLRVYDPNNNWQLINGIPNTPLPDCVSGTFDPIRKEYVANSSTSVFVLDGDPGSATYGQLKRSFPHTITNGFLDMAFNPMDGFIYAIVTAPASNINATLVRINTSSDTATLAGQVAGLPNGTYGRAFYNSDGSLYFIRNSTRVLYKITGTTTFTATNEGILNGISSSAPGRDAAGISGVSFMDTLVCRDTDGDGIPDSLDLDSDNDGIPDNVEAQSTIGYIAPSGNVGANGLDSAYENNDSQTATGLQVINSDGTDLPDYLDLDSDNDGTFDIVESGSGLVDNDNDGRTNDSVGVNGLDNAIDTVDNYTDVNGIINTPSTDLKDTDGDVNNGGDVDYRDDEDLDAVDDMTTTDEDTSVFVDIYNNDTGIPSSGVLTVTQPSNGTVVVTDPNDTPNDPSDDVVTYTPNDDYNGADTFTYTICDSNNTCDSASVNVTINAVDDLPTAVDDTTTVNEDSLATSIDVTDNDDFGGDGPSIGSISLPSGTSTNGGTLTINDNGTPNDPTDDEVNYTPAAGFDGADTFDYTIEDADGDTSTGTVTVTVVKDTDGDNIPDDVDIDDDNDGILDIDEGAFPVSAFPDPAKARLFQVNEVYKLNLQDGIATLEATLPLNNFNAVTANELSGEYWGEDNGQLVTLDPNTFAVTRYPGVSLATSTNSAAFDPFRRIVVFNNSSIFYVVDADPSSPTFRTLLNSFPNTTGNMGDIAYNAVDGLMYGIQSPSNDLISIDIDNSTSTNLGPVTNLPTPGNYGAGYSLINGDFFVQNNDSGVIYSIDIVSRTATVETTAPASGNNDGVKVLFVDLDGNPIARDSDGDGIPDSLDLDSDNDGIPDNVEAQPSQSGSYIVPTGNVGANGLDAVYENGDDSQTASGLAPQNTDSSDLPDYLDLDSDNDGLFDINESGDNLPDNDNDGRTDDPVGDNGLDDNIDSPGNEDGYDDVNGIINIPSTDLDDTDGDVNNGGDVDYRDDEDLDAVDDMTTIDEDTSVAVDTFNNDTGIPTSGVLTVTQPTNGTVAVTDPNSTPNDPSDDVVTYTPNDDYNGADTFTYTICDSNNTCGTASVNVTINAVDDLPTAIDDTATVNEDSGVTSIDVTDNDDFGGDGPSIGTISLSNGTSTNGGTLTINDNGTPNDPTDDEVNYTPAADFNGSDTFDYTIEDADGDTSTGTVTVTVNSVNDLPTAVDDTTTVNEDSLATSIDVTDNDDFGGDGPSIGSISLPSGTSTNGGTLTINDNGTPNDPTDDEVNYTPAAGFDGTDTFDYTIEDADGDTSTATVTVTVSSVNDIPLAIDDTATVNEDSGVTSIDVTDNDDFGGNGPSIGTISLPNGTSTNGGTLTINDNGTPNDPTDDEVNYTPAADFDGTDTFDYTIEDADGDTSTATVTVTVVEDTDSDGIPDSVDIDDDNDGILDTIEICTTTEQATGGVVAAESNAGNTGSGDINDGQITADEGVVMFSDTQYFVLDLGRILEPGSMVRFHIWGNNAATRTAVTSEAPTGTYTATSPINPQANNVSNNNVISFYDYILTGTTQFIQVDMTQRVNGRTEWIEATIINSCSFSNDTDSDNDGVFDQFDLDSDNDGIPDNIEAQTTAGYVAPSGLDDDNDGLDNAYDATPNGNSNGDGSLGITPENTDGTDNPDYLDLDTDNDGVFDIIESGDNLPDTNNDGRTDGVVGSNGLDNSVDNNGVDDYSDVNGKFDDTQQDNFTDSDGDVNAGGDVDYRDVPQIIVANDDSVTVVEGQMNNNVLNILSNDTTGGLQATAANVDITDLQNVPTGVTVDTATGNLSVGGNTVPGTYVITYTLCEEGSTTNCDMATITLVVKPDNDKDGIPDEVDIDDDNDGILDEEECSQNLILNGGFESPVQPTFDDNAGASILPWVIENGARANVVKTDGGLNNIRVPNFDANPATNQVGTVQQHLDIVDGANNFYQTFSLSNSGTATFGGFYSRRFNAANMSIQARIYSGTNGSSGTLVFAGTLETYSGNPENWQPLNESTTLAAGSYSFLIAMDNGAIFDEGFLIANIVCDTDGDGISNEFDLDSDNDGIPDNIEAQTTAGYIAPSGLDDDNDGLDNAYDTTPNGNPNGDGSSGITPENTDGTDLQDYLDLDSDNDGIFDIIESGDNLPDNNNDGRTDDPVGDNGLDDNIDSPGNEDNYDDVNGIINLPSTDLDDTDGDVNNGGDVDYRDIPDIIVANDDNVTVVEGQMNNNVLNILSNDTRGGLQATVANVDITDLQNVPTGVSVDTATGNLSVGGNTVPGTYVITYTLCEEGSTTNCDMAIITLVVQPDNDKDGIPDEVDIDDDNDGVLDTVEDALICNTISTQLANDTITLENFNIQSAVSNVSAIDDNVATVDEGVAMNNPAHYIVFDLGQIYGAGSVIRFDIWGNSAQARTVVNSEVPSGNYNSSGGTNPVTTQVNLNGTDFYTYTLSIATRYVQVDMTARSGGRTEWTEVDINIDCLEDSADIDGDGIINSMDLDSDNDGIPDNVEAQPTLGYDAPITAFVDSDGDGLADQYDATPNGNPNGAGSLGVTPVNTDSANDAIPDYLDLDSDNDGLFDIVESGDNLPDNNNDGRTDDPVGENGLDDNIDSPGNEDNYTDVNGIINNPSNDLDDLDNDVNNGGDVDYRDAENFTVDMPTQTVLENNVFTSISPTLDNAPIGTITYTLTGIDANRFTIDPNTGVVSMVARDFENPVDDNANNFYNLIITATSSAGGSASDPFTVVVNNECEDVDVVMNKLRAIDPIGDAQGNTGTLQVEVTDAAGVPRAGVQVVITKESGPGTIAAATGTTNASGFYTTTVSSGSAGIATYSARYASTAGAADADVELGNPTRVRFLSNINDRDALGEVGIATATPHPSSVLEVSGDDKGLLIPSVALTSCSDTVTIPRPAVSLLVYNTNASPSLAIGFVYFDGSDWRSICEERKQTRQ